MTTEPRSRLQLTSNLSFFHQDQGERTTVAMSMEVRAEGEKTGYAYTRGRRTAV